MLVFTLLSQPATTTKMLATTLPQLTKRPSLSVPRPWLMPVHTSPTTVNVSTSLLQVSTFSPPGLAPNMLPTPFPVLQWHHLTFAAFYLTSFPFNLPPIQT